MGFFAFLFLPVSPSGGPRRPMQQAPCLAHQQHIRTAREIDHDGSNSVKKHEPLGENPCDPSVDEAIAGLTTNFWRNLWNPVDRKM